MRDSSAAHMNLHNPWVQTGSDSVNFENELRRELGPDHPLYGSAATAIARRIDTDDVLFEVTGALPRFAVVHLTWSGRPEIDARWPAVTFFSDLKDWIERGMTPDHQAYERS
jgi:hypothetical protein